MRTVLLLQISQELCLTMGGCGKQPLGCVGEECWLDSTLQRAGNTMNGATVDLEFKVKKKSNMAMMNMPSREMLEGDYLEPNWMGISIMHGELDTDGGLLFVCHDSEVNFKPRQALSIRLCI